MRRPAVGLAFPRLAASLLAALLGAVPACAQTVVGRIVDADGGAGVAGAFVVLADSAGRRRAAVLTDGEGRFVVTAPAAGLYTLRAERIGMSTRTVPAFTLTAAARRTVTLALAAEAVPLAAIEVSGKRRCELRPGAGEATARVWEEVRKALRISAWARSTGLMQFTLRGEERVLDLPSRTVRSDTVREFAGAGARPYASLPAEELARGGYVRQEPDGGYTYWAPDEEVLASDEFLSTHCLELRPRSAARPGMLAIDFRRAKRGGPVDIEGTAWLEARSGELRSVDFEYSGLPFRADEAGGYVAYRRLPSGSWIVERWRLAFPLLRLTIRSSLSGSGIQVGSGQELEAYALHETLGEVVEVRAGDGGRPIRAEARRTGVVSGEVYDSVRARPLTAAHVYLSGTVYAASADSAGRFRIAGVPAGRYAIAFDHPTMDSVPVRPAPVEATVPADGEVVVALAVPGAAELRRRACRTDAARTDRTVVFGRLDDAVGYLAVQLRWQMIEKQAGRLAVDEVGLDVPADAAGRFVACADLPDGRPVTLRVVRRTAAGTNAYGPTVQLAPTRRGLVRVDLVTPRT